MVHLSSLGILIPRWRGFGRTVGPAFLTTIHAACRHLIIFSRYDFASYKRRDERAAILGNAGAG
jgi:hypothetical protein